MSLKAFLFDVDGTLADTERDGHRPAFNQAFADFDLGWNWSVDEYADLLKVTGGKERIRYYCEKYDLPLRHDAAFDQLVKDLHGRKTEHFVGLLSQGRVPLRPGVERLLGEAREQGIRLAIATTTTFANVEGLLNCTLGEEAMGWFEVIGAGDVVPQKKPAPDIYHYVMEKMDLEANQCLAFEDSRNGILSSTAADLKTLITYNGYTENDDFSAAMLVLDQMGEPGKPSAVLQQQGRSHVDVALLQELWQQA